MLVFPPGLDFIAAFFGCLYAGVLPVPEVPMQTATTRAAGCRIAIAAGIATTLLALCGCAGSRVYREPLPDEPSRLGWTAGDRDGVDFTLRQLIVTNNAGTWVRDALWDEVKSAR